MNKAQQARKREPNLLNRAKENSKYDILQMYARGIFPMNAYLKKKSAYQMASVLKMILRALLLEGINKSYN